MADTIIQMKNVSKTYSMGETKLPVIKGLDLEVNRGELVAIMGRSGSGKSTLLNLIAGLETVNTGIIRVDSVEVSTLKSKDKVLFRRDNLGIIYQFFNLVPSLTVEENITLPFLISGERNGNIKARLEEVLDFTGMHKRRQHLPTHLSGGEMQLVSIARALIRKPKVILADEPTGNVNLETGKLIMTKLREVTRQETCSVLLVTHSPEDASWADRIVFLKDGRIEAKNSLKQGETDATHIYNRLKKLGI